MIVVAVTLSGFKMTTIHYYVQSCSSRKLLKMLMNLTLYWCFNRHKKLMWSQIYTHTHANMHARSRTLSAQRALFNKHTFTHTLERVRIHVYEHKIRMLVFYECRPTSYHGRPYITKCRLIIPVIYVFSTVFVNTAYKERGRKEV